MPATTTARDVTAELAFLTRALKAPTLRRRPPRQPPAGQLRRLGRYHLLVIDEVGYIPFEPEAANLFFQLVSSCYERASLIVTSNKPLGRWGEVFGDDTVAAAMIDRLVHDADVIALKGDPYRLKNRDLGRTPRPTTEQRPPRQDGQFHPSPPGQDSAAVDTPDRTHSPA